MLEKLPSLFGWGAVRLVEHEETMDLIKMIILALLRGVVSRRLSVKHVKRISFGVLRCDCLLSEVGLLLRMEGGALGELLVAALCEVVEITHLTLGQVRYVVALCEIVGGGILGP